MTLYTQISKAFHQQATQYEKVALVQKEIGLRLLERLDYMKISPRYILDLGSGSGFITARLRDKYPNAHIIAIDLVLAMLQEAKRKFTEQHSCSLIAANMALLPFPNGLFDLVFANQVVHWALDMKALFSELTRVMHYDGCFLFSTLGPDTFQEIRTAWQAVDNYGHTNEFLDMHDVGDALLQEQFIDPVVDMERLTVHYSSVLALCRSLKSQGVWNIHSNKNKGMTGKYAWKRFVEEYEQYRTAGGKYPVTYEVVYGQAWRGQQRCIGGITETVIPIMQLVTRS